MATRSRSRAAMVMAALVVMLPWSAWNSALPSPMVGPAPLLRASRAYTSASTVRAAARPNMFARPTNTPRSSSMMALRLRLMMLPLVVADAGTHPGGLSHLHQAEAHGGVAGGHGAALFRVGHHASLHQYGVDGGFAGLVGFIRNRLDLREGVLRHGRLGALAHFGQQAGLNGFNGQARVGQHFGLQRGDFGARCEGLEHGEHLGVFVLGASVGCSGLTSCGHGCGH